MKDRMTELFGPRVYSYSRAQALEDGLLVDVSRAVEPCPFKWPVAMTRAAWEATVEAGGYWEQDGDGEVLRLPGGQDVGGRVWDVFSVCLATMQGIIPNSEQRDNRRSDRVYFNVDVDTEGNGRRKRVELYAQCGPGDDLSPVITILLRGED